MIFAFFSRGGGEKLAGCEGRLKLSLGTSERNSGEEGRDADEDEGKKVMDVAMTRVAGGERAEGDAGVGGDSGERIGEGDGREAKARVLRAARNCDDSTGSRINIKKGKEAVPIASTTTGIECQRPDPVFVFGMPESEAKERSLITMGNIDDREATARHSLS